MPSISVARTAPVVGGERPKREIFDADLGRRGRDAADIVGAMLMARQPRQTSLRRPSAVAIHDDRDVARDRGSSTPPGERNRHSRGGAESFTVDALRQRALRGTPAGEGAMRTLGAQTSRTSCSFALPTLVGFADKALGQLVNLMLGSPLVVFADQFLVHAAP